MAPLTPFMADAIYENLDGSEPSVHLCDYPEPDAALRDNELEWQMAVAREAVGLGREARAHGRLKVRQPLREAVVVAAGRERAAIERFESVVLEELNVKSVRYVSEADELGSFELKPNYRALGPALRQAHAPAGRGRWRRWMRRAPRARCATAARCTSRWTARSTRSGRRPAAGAAAARGLPGGALGLARRGARPGPGRRAPPRGPGARGGPRGAERAQGGRAAGGGPHRAGPGGRRGPAGRHPRPRGLRDRRDPGHLARARRRGGRRDDQIEGRALLIGVRRA